MRDDDNGINWIIAGLTLAVVILAASVVMLAYRVSSLESEVAWRRDAHNGLVDSFNRFEDDVYRIIRKGK